MTTHPPTLEMKIGGKTNGQDLRPGVVSSRKIAELITAFEEAIAAIVIAESPQLKKEQIVVGLEGIQTGSVALSFVVNPYDLVMPAARKMGNALENNDFSGLNNPTRECLRKLKNLVSEYQGGVVTIFEKNGSTKQLAVLTAESVIPAAQYIKGDTTLYGEVTRIGGKKPKIQIVNFEGIPISCKATKELVMRVSNKLYQTIGLRGTAKWDIDSLEMIEFQAEELLPYEEAPLKDFFAGLAAIVGEDFVDVDPDKFVYELRH